MGSMGYILYDVRRATDLRKLKSSTIPVIAGKWIVCEPKSGVTPTELLVVRL